MKVGILGGSFNPIHNSHIKIIKAVLENKLANEVWVMPCKVHPLSKEVEDEAHRADMINLAIKDVDHTKLCDIELKKEGTSYTFETLRELRKIYDHDFYLIIGSDLLIQMADWHGREHLQKEAKFIVFKRKEYEIKNPGMQIESIINFQPDNISSTKIREKVKQGESIADLVPAAVERYILKEGLYKD